MVLIFKQRCMHAVCDYDNTENVNSYSNNFVNSFVNSYSNNLIMCPCEVPSFNNRRRGDYR